MPIIASVTGTPDEIRRMADALAELPAVAGVEVNLHCTYEEYRTLGSKAYLEQCAQRIRAAADGRLPVWAKLSPCAGDIVDAARTAQDAGAQAVVCANTYWGMALQADGSSRLGSMVGGLSGPAIRPLSVFQTWRVAQEVAVDVVGCGGIVCAADVKEYMAAGAKAVEIGTANFTEPETIIRITEALYRPRAGKNVRYRREEWTWWQWASAVRRAVYTVSGCWRRCGRLGRRQS